MFYTNQLILLVPIFLAHLAHSVVTSPDGISAGPASSINSGKTLTDINTIFSAICSGATPAVANNTSTNVTPAVLTYFQLVFGPLNAANVAKGYMGVEYLTSYDVAGCAQYCNTRTYDSKSGPCIYFNIWTGVVGSTETSYVCSMYNTVTDNSTATNTGQGTLQVTASRGYSRINLVQDGSFQDFTCILSTGTSCPAQLSSYWTRFYLFTYEYVLINNNPAHSGTSSALFYFNPPQSNSLTFEATLAYTQALNTTSRKIYILSFFSTPNSLTTSSSSQVGTLFSAHWNGVDVLDVQQPANIGTGDTLTYYYSQVEVTANGLDAFYFKNGVSVAHQLYLDDVALFEKWY